MERFDDLLNCQVTELNHSKDDVLVHHEALVEEEKLLDEVFYCCQYDSLCCPHSMHIYISSFLCQVMEAGSMSKRKQEVVTLRDHVGATVESYWNCAIES